MISFGTQDIFYIAGILSLFYFLVKYTLFIIEMEKKSKYKDYVDEAVDAAKNNFGSNIDFGFANTKGMAFFEDKDGKIDAISQSKLCGVSDK